MSTSPITWHGSKGKLASKIIQYFPAHRTYCEPFGGSAAVFLAKVPAEVEIFNDADSSLVNLFRVIRDSNLCAELHQALESTPYSRSEFALAKEKSDNPVEAARRLIVRQRQSRAGLGVCWRYSVRDAEGNMAAVVKRWRSGIDGIPAVHRRFRNVQIEADDWRLVLSRYDSSQTLFYLDPPYHPATVVGGSYNHELTRADHHELVARLLSLRGMIAISGYQNAAYRPLERAGWKRVDFAVPAGSSDKRTRGRIESLWLSLSVVNHAENRKHFMSPTERIREGARQSHSVQVAASLKKVSRAIERLRADGKRITKSSVARATKHHGFLAFKSDGLEVSAYHPFAVGFDVTPALLSHFHFEVHLQPLSAPRFRAKSISPSVAGLPLRDHTENCNASPQHTGALR
jgi:DNA adenine methylase